MSAQIIPKPSQLQDQIRAPQLLCADELEPPYHQLETKKEEATTRKQALKPLHKTQGQRLAPHLFCADAQAHPQ